MSRPLETWEEVELHRPKAPAFGARRGASRDRDVAPRCSEAPTLEGYVRPVGAPEQLDIPREQRPGCVGTMGLLVCFRPCSVVGLCQGTTSL